MYFYFLIIIDQPKEPCQDMIICSFWVAENLLWTDIKSFNLKWTFATAGKDDDEVKTMLTMVYLFQSSFLLSLFLFLL